MKVAVSSTGDSLESEIDLRFGRCQYFILYDDESKEIEALDNSAQLASGGAGVRAAQAIAKSGAEIVLTGSVGPNAFQALQLAGLSVYTGASGTVIEAIKKYRTGELDNQVMQA